MDHSHHSSHSLNSSNMAVSATLHCLSGCAIGEVAGLMIGTALGLASGVTILIAVSLAFLFGYLLSTLPLLKAGLTIGSALKLVLAADTLSIATMEVVDNGVMAMIPGAMDTGLMNPIFWMGMAVALIVAFCAAYPVNRWLLSRGKGHALVHGRHGTTEPQGWRQNIPDISSTMLIAILAAFMAGGLAVSIVEMLSQNG